MFSSVAECFLFLSLSSVFEVVSGRLRASESEWSQQCYTKFEEECICRCTSGLCDGQRMMAAAVVAMVAVPLKLQPKLSVLGPELVDKDGETEMS